MTAIAATTLADLGWPQLVEHWAARCASTRGAAAVRGHVFYDDAAEARTRIAEVAEARDLAARDAALPLGGIEDVAGAIERVRKAAALDAPELLAVAGTARAVTRLRAHLRQHAEIAPRLAGLGAELADLGHLFHPILEAFDPDGRLVDHASDALGPLRRALAGIRGQLDKRMDTLVGDPRFAPYLQDSFYTQRDDRYVLPVRHDGKGFVKGILHGTSGSGQTLFIEPEEIVDLNNRLKLAECDVLDEERRILAKFSGWVAEEADAIDVGVVVAEVLDVIAASARLADDLVASAPIVDDAPRIGLLHARHPLMLLSDRRCVANDITVAAATTLLVSGPNAGGKTVALKTSGLAALMVRAGLHVPAESGSVMGWFDDVRTDIGDAQSLERDLSTFTGHVLALRTFLTECGAGTLLLIDEIAVGTDPDQGAALAQAVLEALAARGVTAIVTTHYERLKAMGAVDPRFANASVGYDLQRMAPTFKLHLGTPGSSGALTVARTMGLPGPIVERAQGLLGEAGANVELLLERVADQRRRLEEERALQLDELEALEAERMALRADRDRHRARAEKQAAAAYGEAMTSLRQARAEAEQVRAELRRKAAEAKVTAEDVQQARRKLAGVGAEVARHQPARGLPPGRAPRDGELVPGTPGSSPASAAAARSSRRRRAAASRSASARCTRRCRSTRCCSTSTARPAPGRAAAGAAARRRAIVAPRRSRSSPTAARRPAAPRSRWSRARPTARPARARPTAPWTCGAGASTRPSTSSIASSTRACCCRATRSSSCTATAPARCAPRCGPTSRATPRSRAGAPVRPARAVTA
ncbi:MAG: endonuclease MutS2 [Kofleriaceae bacterium]|nr:endonuclease MutS2 [Kofleriaceae bacterium]